MLGSSHPSRRSRDSVTVHYLLDQSPKGLNLQSM